jgi:hypothetical protein
VGGGSGTGSRRKNTAGPSRLSFIQASAVWLLIYNVPKAPGNAWAPEKMHGPRSIDEELDHLTKELELTPEQRKQIRPLLVEHHDKIQALVDSNPKLSRKDLQPQIHAISEETHRQIDALLSEHQKQLETAMQSRMHTRETSCRNAEPSGKQPEPQS